MGKLAEMIEKLFGISTHSYLNRDVAQIPLAAGRVMRANPDRIGCIMINCGANVAYVHILPDVGALNGITLGPNGGFVSMVYDKDFDLLSHEWYGIAPGGAVNCIIMEVIG